MQTANHRYLFSFWTVFILTTLFLVAPTTVSAQSGTTQTQSSAATLLNGITLDSSLNDADIAFLKTGLQFLHDRLPVWFDYLEQAKPLMLTVDAKYIMVGTIAFADCCDAQGVATITLGYHFGTIAVTDKPIDQSIQARQVAFLGYLMHEATHLRDQRAGRIPRKMDATICVVGEKAALTQVLNFKRAITLTVIDDDSIVDTIYRFMAQSQVNEEADNLDNERYWNRYCGIGTEFKLTNGTDYAMARLESIVK
jgi:hypothetical protein